MPKLKITEPGKKARSYSIKITRETITLGRKDDNDIMLEHPSVSSDHAKIRRVEGGYVLDDLDSTNGSKVESVRFIHIDLEADTTFRLGDVYIDFSLSDEECDILDEEDDFVSEEREKTPSKKSKKKSKKNDSQDDEDDNDDITEEEEDDYDDEEGGGSLTFIVAVIAFIITIIIALAALYFTGNLSL